jgi:2-amino-4-hydroxy-6-hydroxymethyldihydropteridine diphosphokinase
VPRCWIGLGGNEGDVPVAIRQIVERLSQHPEAAEVVGSPLFRTAPVGANAGATFWNAVAGFDTQQPPLAWLDQLQAWEADFGRVRTTHWGPRTLDLDLLFYGDQIIHHARLTLPHPGAWYRRFVLDPLATVAPQLRHPVWGLSITELLDRLRAPPPTLIVWNGTPDAMPLRDSLAQRLPGLKVLSDAEKPSPSGLMASIGPAPQTWHAAPHLTLSPNLPREQQLQVLIDAAAAAFDVPLRVD